MAMCSATLWEAFHPRDSLYALHHNQSMMVLACALANDNFRDFAKSVGRGSGDGRWVVRVHLGVAMLTVHQVIEAR